MVSRRDVLTGVAVVGGAAVLGQVAKGNKSYKGKAEEPIQRKLKEETAKKAKAGKKR